MMGNRIGARIPDRSIRRSERLQSWQAFGNGAGRCIANAIFIDIRGE